MTAQTSRFLARTAAVLIASLALAGEATAAAAGKILFVSGSVTLERTPAVALKAGDAISTGDVILTGEKARAQLLMNDGARIALRAASRYRIDEFGLPAAVGAPTQATTTQAGGVSVATLLKGGYRASTGAIGKDGAGQYEVRTPIGTLGIRGTDYTAVWCQGDCADVPGLAPSDAARNGMYLATNVGAIVFRFGTREVVVNAGETVFIAAANAEPEPLERVPRWLLEDSAGPIETGEREDKAGAATALPDFSDRRQPDTGQQTPGDTGVDPSDPNKAPGKQRPITGTFGGQNIDLTSGQLPQRGPNDPPFPGQPSPSQPPPINQPPPGTAAPPPSNNMPPPPPNVPPPPGGN